MAELFFEDDNIGMQDRVGTPMEDDMWDANYYQQNYRNQPFPHTGLGVLPAYGNFQSTPFNPDQGNVKRNSFMELLSKLSPLRGILQNLNPQKLRGYNIDEDRYNTQAEYEENRAARQQDARVKNMLSRRAAGKGFSQKNLNEQTMGSRPGYYNNITAIGGDNVGNINRDRGSISSPGYSTQGGFTAPSQTTGTQHSGAGTSDVRGHHGNWAQGGRIGYAFAGPVGVEQQTDFIEGPRGDNEFQETVVEGQEQPSREQLEALAMKIFQLPLEELDDQQLVVVYQTAMQGQPMEEAVQEEDVQFAARGGLASLL